VYNSIEEYNTKYLIFEKNFLSVSALKSLYNGSDPSFEFGISPFMDLTPEDFKAKYLTLDVNYVHKLKFLNAKNVLAAKSTNAPGAWDWRQQGAVTPVKNQGYCGSCWAFSTVGNIEGQYFIKTKKLQRFSEQQLVDCDKVDRGCNGGLMEDGFKHLNSTGGAMAEQDYLYTATVGSCKFNKTLVKTQVTGQRFAASRNETEIAQMLYETGPLSIALNASPLQFYSWGVIDPSIYWICDPKALNHGVLLVGYGNDGVKDYWISKNSWGPWWGEYGYFRIVKGSGACGINTYVMTADVVPLV
jgi:cathepsin F